MSWTLKRRKDLAKQKKKVFSRQEEFHCEEFKIENLWNGQSKTAKGWIYDYSLGLIINIATLILRWYAAQETQHGNPWLKRNLS
jgi:hypothetical protein